MMKKIKVAVLFGGCSDEYSVSLHSAAGVLRALDPQRYEMIQIGIDRQGDWFLTSASPAEIEADQWHQPENQRLQLTLARSRFELKTASNQPIDVDVFFPVLHGRNGEDGSLQGMFELFHIPFVGCGLDASLLGMDKALSHQLAQQHGSEVSPFLVFNSAELDQKRSQIQRLKLPCFVKPARGGSSIGITKITTWKELDSACAAAAKHDSRILIEEAVVGEEIGCSVLETAEGLVLGAVDRIHLNSDFFDYEEKYVDTHAEVECPAPLPDFISEQMRRMALKLWEIHHCHGLVRVDCFLTDDQRIVFNEINTLPGMTATSRYPRMMGQAGITFEMILDTLINEALRRSATWTA